MIRLHPFTPLSKTRPEHPKWGGLKISATLGLLATIASFSSCSEAPASSTSKPTPVASNTEAKKKTPAAKDDKQLEKRRVMEAIDRSESVIVTLTALLSGLSKSAMNLTVPGDSAPKLFAEEVTFYDLDADASAESLQSFQFLELEKSGWPVLHDSKKQSRSELDLWRPFFETVAYFDFAKFYNIDGGFTNEEETEFESVTGFKGLAILNEGTPAYATGKVLIRWERVEVDSSESEHAEEGDAEKPKSTWRIIKWKTKNFETMSADSLLFEDVLESAIPNPEELRAARRSIHEELIVQNFIEGDEFKRPHEFFNWAAFDRHPAVSVVDIDRDGFDDFYLMARWGPNQLFRNRGDGTFEEIAEELGLAIEGHCSSSIFADYDNDGDLDVAIGRTLNRSMYLENVDGRFVDRTRSHIKGEMPGLVSSINAVDYNNDGLLDLYFGTYAGQIVDTIGPFKLLSFLPKNVAASFSKLLKTKGTHRTKNRIGPPNLLYRNIGNGEFQLVENIGALASYRNTFQAGWADFDEDGDADVYIANDFALNQFVRNDGNGKFTSITDETGTADIGFGMGNSWGDYDNDGQLDLYVTNMFSKAGKRITRMAGEFGTPFEDMAKGNSLFRNNKGTFERVSGTEDSTLRVSAAGWGWGSQFVDVDNDGYLDIYAICGHYTAPKQFAIAADT